MPTTPEPPKIKPTHKAITHYYATLEDLAHHNVSHEMGLRRAFQELLAETAKLHDWTLITEESSTTIAGNAIRPDATLRDKNTLPRGFWESKDTNDSLSKEIAKKSAKGYSLANTIFEDSQTAILYQNKNQAFTADLSDPQALCDLLNQFYSHTEPDIEQLEQAINDFKDRVPDLARGLVDIIAAAHKKNIAFKKAFADFFTLCQTALNPNIAESAVDEMLVQHLLTERLFTRMFDNPDFIRRNVIAAEVEKVIAALASQSFSRSEYLKGLDRFYLAIENAAKHLEWNDKQHFLNIVYERFFQGYSVKTADTMGIVYTPQPIVDFMCASVAEVLKTEFKKELGDPDVFILDPCTGTGNFIVNLLKRIPPKKLPHAYAHNLFANEIMLLPYYIAALNVEHAHYELTGKYEPFEGLCFVDTLDIAEHKQKGFDFFTQKNTDRVERQKKAPITIVIGNPPYNVGQMVHNDQNKNRPYPQVDRKVKSTYSDASSASSVSKLNDPYVKFIRWATDRLGTRDGMVCLVTNNSFLDQVAFDGMRKHLLQDFTDVYHFDLKGNVRKNPTLSGTQYNVFGIQLGVGITLFIRRQKTPWSMATGRPSHHARTVHYKDLPVDLPRRLKLEAVSSAKSVLSTTWEVLTTDEKNNWLVSENAAEFGNYVKVASRECRDQKTGTPDCVFKDYSLGIATHRDSILYDFDSSSLLKRVKDFISRYNIEIDKWKRADNEEELDDVLDQENIVWDEDLKKNVQRFKYAKFSNTAIRSASLRPFTRQHLYFDRTLISRSYGFPSILPSNSPKSENQFICVAAVGNERPFYAIALDAVPALSYVGFGGGCQCFPFYTYDEDGSNRRENITDWALNQFREHYHDKKISKWNIFHYVYALLHHPAYRTKFADNLKRELPRIPFAPAYIAPGLPGVTARKQKAPAKPNPSSPGITIPAASSAFHAFAAAGKKLADLHLHYEDAKEFPLSEIITPGMPRSPRVDSKMKLSKDKSSVLVNDSLTLGGIPPETFNYKLGNRSALDWIIDQYQLYTDPRTQITSDPNAWGDEHNNPEYIVQLLAKIITVSLETQRIIEALPTHFAPETS